MAKNELQLHKTGSLSIKGTFSSELKQGVQVLTYGEFQTGFKINKNRVVTKLL